MRRTVYIIMALILVAACKDPYKDQLFKAYDRPTVAQWIQSDANYSMWEEMLRRADLLNAMNLGSGIYTCFVAGNEAVAAYLDIKGYDSLDDMPQDELEYLVRYHIINGSRINGSNLLLKLSLPTLSGDYLTAGVNVETEERYIDNGEGKPVSNIVAKDISATNGIIHVLDRVLQPITESVWDIIRSNDGYSIFSEALHATGLDVYLNNTYVEVLGVQLRENKTVFVVPDSVFEQHGINDFDTLLSSFSCSDAANPESDFYKYVAYHIMDRLYGYAELTSFPSGFSSMIVHNHSNVRGYSILDRMGSIVFNPNPEETSFHISDARRDIPAKNGYVHEIDNLGLIPEYMEHYVVEWETTDRIEFGAIPFYRAEKAEGDSAEEYEIISNGLEIPGIRYESVPAGKAQIWYHNEHPSAVEYKNNDALYWNMGNIGWIEFDTPVLPAGTYRLEAVKSKNSSNGGKCFVYWDGDEASLAGNSEINFVGGVYYATWTTRKILREEAHTIRFTVGSTAGVCGIDRLVFTPIED